MIKKITLAIAITAIAIMAFHGISRYVFSYDGGAPSGYANDPANGSKNCTNCHGGSPTTVSGWIASNVPGTGYIPGNTYQFTATSTGTGGNKGFSISPQNSSGAFKGTLIAATGTKLTSSSHYVTNSGSGITTNPYTWNFSWTAPVAGTGSITFYGSFAIGTGNTFITTYTISENPVGINEASAENKFSLFPNPAFGQFTIEYYHPENGNVVLNLFSFQGKKIAELLNKTSGAGNHSEMINTNEIAQGIYMLQLKVNGKTSYRKLMIN